MTRKRVAWIIRERETALRRSRWLMKQARTAPPSPDLIQRDFTVPTRGLDFVEDFICLPTAVACCTRQP